MNAKYAAGTAGAILMATVGFASAQTATTTPSGPAFGVLVSPTPVVRPGTGDALLALVILSAERSNSAIQIQSLPVSMSFSGGLNAASLTDCRVRNVTSLATSLNTSGVNATSEVNTFNFSSSLQTDAGRTTTLALTCDVDSMAPVGGTILLSVTPANISATVSGSSTSVTPTTGFTLNGNLGATSGSVLVSSAANPGGPVIPGVPNTGFGDDSNLMILAASALAIILGAVLLRRRIA